MEVKRNISEVSSISDDHNDKKSNTRPGRKPIDTEPKSKRTAQNRAAQRAYRERKERKMQDLEDKVKSLEVQNVKATTETDFLKAQVATLMNELSRYRGHSDFSDLDLPTKVGTLSHPQRGGTKKNPSYEYTASKPSSVDISSSDPSPSEGIPSDFNWMKENQDLKNGSMNIPDLVSGSSSSTSPLNENILFSPDSSNTDSTPNANSKSTNSESYDFKANFDEQLDPFCARLNESCGTKQSPVPKNKSRVSTQMSASPFSTLNGSKEVKPEYLNEPFLMNGDFTSMNFTLSPGADSYDPLSRLTDTSFDVALAFKDSFDNRNEYKDPVKSLTTEESVYDPLNEVTNFEFNDFIRNSESESQQSSQSNSQQNDFSQIRHSEYSSSRSNSDLLKNSEEVVPADSPVVRCPEIWERVTSHPRYTDIDIDGLCSELKNKAKCSEKGFVMNTSDMNTILEQSTIFKN